MTITQVKSCVKCNNHIFYLDRNKKRLCLSCHQKRLHLYEKSPKGKQKRKGYNFKRQYNFSVDEFQKLKKQQKGRCAICHKRKQLCVDHNHKSRKIRGLLCRTCNLAIGFFFDQIQLLEEAIRYLRDGI